MSKNSILKGTLILTIAGFATRIIGFFYRIFLSNLLKPEDMGVYQLIFPVYGICFTLYASGIQTSISRLIAAEIGKGNTRYLKKILRTGMFFSITIALTLSFFLNLNSSFIATNILLESRCSGSLKILSYLFPFCGITACINGYYYGIKRAGVPAMTQLFEQIIRVVSVYALAPLFAVANSERACELAVWGIVLGEIASNAYNIISMLFIKPSKIQAAYKLKIQSIRNRMAGQKKQVSFAGSLLKLAVPLTSNRLLIGILSSIEAILIPSMLREHGLSTAEALSVYGVLTGMSIPFIMFPSTITNSFAVLLLPTVSEAQAAGNNNMIYKTAALSMKYSLIIGILSTGIFITFGNSLGLIVFNNKAAGIFLTILAWLCPFLYLTTTLSSILNGLGKPHVTFFNTVVGLSVRIAFVIIFVPKHGIWGYLIGMLVSQVFISTLDTLAILRNIKISFHAMDWIVKPGLITAFVGFLTNRSYLYIKEHSSMNGLLLLLSFCVFLVVCYVILLFITKAIRLEEFHRSKS
ncbi:putative polysaccharide biosynthesis protein [Anaerosporobacter faecicola]|uniref:putative polysaccharide biosynthesis protein n=1 Tax=Anaerosporobacter faecicola TaxID=2718714 RepID=UPI00143A2962|nr:polysaccharide biosynthesis protein [Anaerosporobacter faecicola]